jgi:hypothetical protein
MILGNFTFHPKVILYRSSGHVVIGIAGVVSVEEFVIEAIVWIVGGRGSRSCHSAGRSNVTKSAGREAAVAANGKGPGGAARGTGPAGAGAKSGTPPAATAAAAAAAGAAAAGAAAGGGACCSGLMPDSE